MLKNKNSNQVFIYALINPITNKVFYVGATIFLERRYKEHINTKFNSDYRAEQIRRTLLGGQKVEMLVLSVCSKKEAQKEEEFYIGLFKFYGFKLQQKEKSGYPCETIELSDSDIVQCLADGLKVPQISKKAKVSIHVMEKRMESLKKKNGAKNAVHLMSIYFRKKLIT